MADDVIVLTVPMWQVLNAAKNWYREKAVQGEGDPDSLARAEVRLFEAIRTLEVTEALKRAARRNGKPITPKVKKARTTSMRPPPMPEKPEPRSAFVLAGEQAKRRKGFILPT